MSGSRRSIPIHPAMDAPPAPPVDPRLIGGSISARTERTPFDAMPAGTFDPAVQASFIAPPRPDGAFESIRAYVRSSSLRVTGVLFGLMVAGLVIGYATGPHNPFAAASFGPESPGSFTVAGIFLHNLLIVCIPLVMFPLLFWAPAATSAATGFAVGQLTAAWLALRLPGGLLIAALLPHGVVEIPALLLGGTMVWRIGTASWKEKQFGASWNERAAAALRAAILPLVVVVLALGLAAFIEVKITPIVVSHLAGS
jgi:uncharacterized membrane protein SpoIIM required for sporulation